MKAFRAAHRRLRRRVRALSAQALVASLFLQLIVAALPSPDRGLPLSVPSAAAETIGSPEFVSAAVMPNGQVGLLVANSLGTTGEVRFVRYTGEHAIAASVLLSTAVPWYPQLATFRGRLVAAYVDTRTPNSGQFVIRASDDNGVTWSAEAYPFGAETFSSGAFAPRVVASRDGQTLYVFTAVNGAAPQYRSSIDPTLVVWTTPVVAGDASMRVASANNCGNSGQECYRAHAYSFMETASAGRWLYVAKSDAGFGQSGRGTQVGTLGGAWSAQVDLGGSGGLSGCCGESTATTFLDRAGNVYYIRAGSFGEYLYFQKSVDGGLTWGAQVQAYSSSLSNYTTAAPVGLYVSGYTSGEYVWYAGFGGSENTVRVLPLWVGAKEYVQTGTVRLFGSAGGDLDPGSAFPYNFADPPRSLGAGAYTTSATDLSLPGRLLPLAFTRTYNSADESAPGVLGPGWTHSFEWSLVENGTLVTMRRGDGARLRFTRNADGTYAGEPGVFDVLTKSALPTGDLAQGITGFVGSPPAAASPCWDHAGQVSTVAGTPPCYNDGSDTSSWFPSGTYGCVGSCGFYAGYDTGAITTAVGSVRILFAGSNASSWPHVPAERWQVECGGGAGTGTVAYGPAPYPATADTGQVTLTSTCAPGSAIKVRNVGDLKDSAGQSVSWGVASFSVFAAAPAFTLVRRDQVSYEFNATGALTRVREPAGNQISLSYSGGTLTAVTDTVGRQVALSYDSSGRLTQIQDPSGRRVRYAYDGSGRLGSVWDKLAMSSVNAQYRGTVVSDVPTAYWRLGETAGPTALDERSVANGTYAGGVTYGRTPGILDTNTAISVDGTGSVAADGAGALNVTGSAVSVEAWVRGGGQGSYKYIVSKSDDSGSVGYALYTGPSATLRFFVNTTASGFVSAVAPNSPWDGAWHHVVGTYDGAFVRLYVDGSGVASSAATGTIQSSVTRSLVLGSFNGGGFTYVGDLDEVAVYSTGLSAARVSAHYAAASGIGAPSWTYGYDGASRHLATITDPDGRVVVTNTYDALGRLAQQTDAATKTTTFAYGSGQMVATDPRGTATTISYDARDRVIQRSRLVGAQTVRELFEYDACGDTSATIDRNGARTDYAYDATCHGNVLTRTDPQLDPQTPRYVTTFQYDAKNNVTKVIDARGFVTTHTYDPTSNVRLSTTRQIDAATSATTKFEYGDAANPGLPTKVISPRGNTGPTPDHAFAATFAYDAQGDLASATDADGNKTTYAYDTLGRRTAVVDPDGNAAGGVPADHTWSSAYDPNDRVTSETDALGHATLHEYDGAGHPVTLTDRNGNITAYTYDAVGRLHTVQQKPDPVGSPTLVYTTTVDRDANGNAVKVTQANGVVTDRAYDALDRLTSVTTHPSATTALTTTYVLDGNGDTTSRITADGVTTSYTYDGMSRLTSVAAPGLATITYAYDALSRRTAMSDATGTSTYAYDGLGRLVQAVQPSGTTSYGYDLDSDRTALTYPGASTVTYTFSSAGRLTSLTDWAGHTTTYAYTPSGLAKTVTLPAALGGLVTTYAYDRAQRLVSLTNALGAATITSHAYTLDNEGDRTALDEVVPGITPPATTDHFALAYDGLLRLAG